MNGDPLPGFDGVEAQAAGTLAAAGGLAAAGPGVHRPVVPAGVLVRAYHRRPCARHLLLVQPDPCPLLGAGAAEERPNGNSVVTSPPTRRASGTRRSTTDSRSSRGSGASGNQWSGTTVSTR